MTISGALNGAMSGLRAAGRASQLVSSNIANAMTPGYAPRALALSSSTVGTGVRVEGIVRNVDEGLASDRRLALAERTNIEVRTNFLSQLEGLLGNPGDSFSLSSGLARFESSLISAASRPDAQERLGGVVNAANDLANVIKTASEGVQAERGRADRNIAAQVTQLNNALQQVQSLNSQITASQVQGGDVAALADYRQQVIDEISELAPVRQVPRDNGQVALYTLGGAILVDGKAATIEFQPVNQVTPYLSRDAGTLSGLTINGIEVRTGSADGALRGGAIAAQFEVRDETAVTAQIQLDAIARDLIERFQDPAVDPSIAAGDAGLFTDQGAAFDVTLELGLAARISVNASVDPEQGGETWRVRDGVGATTRGEVGDASLLLAFKDVMNDTRVPASGDFGGVATNAFDLTAGYTSAIGAAQTSSEQMLTYASARYSELNERQLADGVDTDNELRNLLLIEQAYSANARMLQAADEMMQTILRI